MWVRGGPCELPASLVAQRRIGGCSKSHPPRSPFPWKGEDKHASAPSAGSGSRRRRGDVIRCKGEDKHASPPFRRKGVAPQARGCYPVQGGRQACPTPFRRKGVAPKARGDVLTEKKRSVS